MLPLFFFAGYAHHDNDYWDERVGPIVDLWDTNGPAFSMNSSCLAYYNGTHGCEQPGSNPSYTVGPEVRVPPTICVCVCVSTRARVRVRIRCSMGSHDVACF